MKIQKARKKLHENLTQTRRRDPYRLELDTSGSRAVTPRNDDIADKIITYYDNGEKFERDEKKKGFSSVPNKGIAPPMKNFHRTIQKNPSSQNLYKNIVTDAVFEKKFKMFVEKSLHTITDIR